MHPRAQQVLEYFKCLSQDDSMHAQCFYCFVYLCKLVEIGLNWSTSGGKNEFKWCVLFSIKYSCHDSRRLLLHFLCCTMANEEWLFFLISAMNNSLLRNNIKLRPSGTRFESQNLALKHIPSFAPTPDDRFAFLMNQKLCTAHKVTKRKVKFFSLKMGGMKWRRKFFILV